MIRKTLPIPTGTSQIEFVNVYQGKLPDVVILAMVSDTAMSAGYQANPFHFHYFGANYLCIQANGEQIHRLAFQPNFTNRDYIRSYFGGLQALGFEIRPNSWDLTPAEWPNGYNIYGFKITHGPIGTVRSPARLGSARLEIRFSAQTTVNLSVLLLSQHSAEIQIDKNKNIIPIN